MFGKGPFGNKINISAEIVNGVCPKCIQPTILVSLYSTLYKCTTCGENLEQKVNGVISYIPMGNKDGYTPELRDTYDGYEKETIIWC